MLPENKDQMAENQNMRFLSERCFYASAVLLLTITAIVVPLLLMRSNVPTVTYIFLRDKSTTAQTNKPKSLMAQRDFTGFSIEENTPEIETDFTTINDTTEPDLETTLEEEDLEPEDITFIDDYKTEAMLEEYLTELAEKDDWVSKIKIGDSVEGRPINAMVIKKTDTPKPSMLMVTGIYGGDWRSTLLSIYMMKTFTLRKKKSSEFLDKFDLHFIPLLNPDGYNLSKSGPPINLSHPTNAVGYNIAKDFEDEENFQPETQAFVSYFNEHKADIKLVFILMSPLNPDHKHVSSICLPESFQKLSKARYDYFVKMIIRQNNKYCEGMDDPDIMDNWIVSQTKSTPIVVVKHERDYRHDIPEDNLDFVKRFGVQLYNQMIDIYLLADDSHDPLALRTNSTAKETTSTR